MIVQSIFNLFSSSSSNNNNNNRNNSHHRINPSSTWKSDAKKQTKQTNTTNNNTNNQNNKDGTDDEVLVIKLRENVLEENKQQSSSANSSPSPVAFQRQRSDGVDPERQTPLPRYRLRSIISTLSSSKTPAHPPSRSKQIKIALPKRNNSTHYDHLDSTNSSIPSASSNSLSRALSRKFSKSINPNPTSSTITSTKLKPLKKRATFNSKKSLSSSTLSLSLSSHLKASSKKSVDRTDDRSRPVSNASAGGPPVKKDSTTGSYLNALKRHKDVSQDKVPSLMIHKSSQGEPRVKLKEVSPVVTCSNKSKMDLSQHHLATMARSSTTPISSNVDYHDPHRFRFAARSHSEYPHQLDLDLEQLDDNPEDYTESAMGMDADGEEDVDHPLITRTGFAQDPFYFNHRQLESPSNQPPAINTTQTPRKTNSRYALCDFELIRTLGTGSFGRVHLAKSRHNGRGYAIKVLNKKRVVSLKQVEHTNSERQMLAAVRHPFLVNLWGTFADSYNLYMVMDFVSGGELFNLLRKSQRFPDPVAKFFGAEVALALDYLHCLDIVYRDLKPENILLGSDGHIKITDFGFAKLVPDITWTLCGTPDYLAPEIVQSKGYNKSVDWYALGVLIFEMLAGYPPFYCEDESPMRLYEKIIAGKVRYPSYFNPSAKDLLKSLLTSDLSKRFGNLANGSRDIFHHAWFAEVDWERLYRKQIPAPYVPRVSSEWDSSNFDHYDEASLEEYGKVGEDPYGHLFPGF